MVRMECPTDHDVPHGDGPVPLLLPEAVVAAEGAHLAGQQHIVALGAKVWLPANSTCMTIVLMMAMELWSWSWSWIVSISMETTTGINQLINPAKLAN